MATGNYTRFYPIFGRPVIGNMFLYFSILWEFLSTCQKADGKQKNYFELLICENLSSIML